MKKVGIIGYGRFGKVLANLLINQYEVKVYDPQNQAGELAAELDVVLESVLVFVAVPIRAFETVIGEIAEYILYNTTIVDVCSVKVYPVEIMEKMYQSMWGLLPATPILDLILTRLLKN